MSTQSDFDTKVAFVKGWTYGGSKVTNDEKLACYGLFKSAPPRPRPRDARVSIRARSAGR